MHVFKWWQKCHKYWVGVYKLSFRESMNLQMRNSQMMRVNYMLTAYEIPHYVRCRSHIVNSSLKYLCPANPHPHQSLTHGEPEGQANYLVLSLGAWRGLAMSAALQVCTCVRKGLFPNGHFLGPKPYFLFPHGQFNRSSQIAKPNALIAHILIPLSWQPEYKL